MGLSLPTFQELNHRFWHHPRSQTIPNNAKINDQIFVVKERWSNKGLIHSPLLLHIQHQSTINKSLLWRLSNVKFFPIVAVHTKKHHLSRDPSTPNALSWRRVACETPKDIMIATNLKYPTLCSHPQNSISTMRWRLMFIEHLKKKFYSWF